MDTIQVDVIAKNNILKKKVISGDSAGYVRPSLVQKHHPVENIQTDIIYSGGRKFSDSDMSILFVCMALFCKIIYTRIVDETPFC